MGKKSDIQIRLENELEAEQQHCKKLIAGVEKSETRLKILEELLYGKEEKK